MLKKICIMLAVLCIALCAAACGSEPEASQPNVIAEKIDFTLVGEGTEESPYLIATMDDLLQFAGVMNDDEQYTDYNSSHFRLTADIELNDCSGFDTWDKNPPENSWVPIGYYHNFRGVFDGNGHTISGLYIDQPVTGIGSNNLLNKFGLFGTNSGEIKNLTIEKAYVYPKRSEENRPLAVGIIVGSDSGTITGCNAEGIVICEGVSCGGIAGSGGNLIADCSFTGKLLEYSERPADNIGGIAGSCGIVIRNCSVSAQIICEYTNEPGVRAVLGGIAGYHAGFQEESVIENCTFDGEINSGSSAGGIVGWGNTGIGSQDKVTKTIVRNCTNNGSITAAEDAGGITGSVSDFRTGEFRVENCTNTGALRSLDGENVCAAGGIVGYIGTEHDGSVIITGCSNESKLRATMPGGIVGRITQNTGNIRIEKCTNQGAIFGEHSYAGGILCHILQWGDGWTLEIDQCVNEGDITTEQNAGGIVCFAYDANPEGSDRNLTISGCVNRGDLCSTGTNNYMGGILGVNTLLQTPVTITDCVNEGNLEYTGEIVVDAETLSNTLVTLSRISGGIVGYVGNAPYITVRSGERTLSNINSENAYLNILNCSSEGDLLHTEVVLAEDVDEAVLEIWRSKGVDNVLNYFIALEGGIVGTIADSENFSVNIADCSYTNVPREIDDWNRFPTGS